MRSALLAATSFCAAIIFLDPGAAVAGPRSTSLISYEEAEQLQSQIEQKRDEIGIEVLGLAPTNASYAAADSREETCSSLSLWCSGSCSSLRKRLFDWIAGNNKCVLIAGTCKRDILCGCDWFGGKETEVPCDPSKPMSGAASQVNVN